MSKEIKEKCIECIYYNGEQQYPDVEGATTHLNCISLKCRYRKLTKDMKISGLQNKIADLEAKLAESEKFLKDNGFKDWKEVLNALAGKFTQIFDEKHEIWIKVVDDFTKCEKENKQLKQKLAEKDDELLQKEKKIQDLMLCEFVAKTLDFNKLSAGSCRLREELAESEDKNKRLKDEVHKSNVGIAHLKNQLKQAKDKLSDKDAEHELLINQFEEETEKLRKQIKQESDARKRFVEEVKNLKQQLSKAIVPKLEIGQRVYMIPNEFNGLNNLTEYEVLDYNLSSLGVRFNLTIINKQKGIEPFYCASEDMIGLSIFSTKEEAESKLKELKGDGKR